MKTCLQTHTLVNQKGRQIRFVYILSRVRNGRGKWGGKKKKKNLSGLYLTSKHSLSDSELFSNSHSETFFPFAWNHLSCALGPNPYTFGSLGIGPIKAKILKCVTNPTHFLTLSFQLHVTTATENRKLATFTHKWYIGVSYMEKMEHSYMLFPIIHLKQYFFPSGS